LNCRSRAPTRSVLSSSASAAGSCIPSRSRGRVIGKGKASAPYEFGVKALDRYHQCRAPGGHSCCTPNLPGNPYDGHTLGVVIEDTETALPAARSSVAYVDKDIVGTARPIRAAFFISGQSAASSASSSANCDAVRHRGRDRTHEDRRSPRRCHLKGRQGDAANVILTAVGHNLRLVLAWLRGSLSPNVLALLQAFATRSALKSAS